jgi:hypothetical protein
MSDKFDDVAYFYDEALLELYTVIDEKNKMLILDIFKRTIKIQELLREARKVSNGN